MSIYEQHVRKQRIKTGFQGFLWFGKYVAPCIIGAFLLLLAAWGINGAINSNNNDYAGYGPNHVTNHNFHALGEWIGFDAKQISRKRSHYATHDAWATQYTLDKKPVCVYVWGGSGPEQSQVVEGACA